MAWWGGTARKFKTRSGAGWLPGGAEARAAGGRSPNPPILSAGADGARRGLRCRAPSLFLWPMRSPPGCLGLPAAGPERPRDARYLPLRRPAPGAARRRPPAGCFGEGATPALKKVKVLEKVRGWMGGGGTPPAGPRPSRRRGSGARRTPGAALCVLSFARPGPEPIGLGVVRPKAGAELCSAESAATAYLAEKPHAPAPGLGPVLRE